MIYPFYKQDNEMSCGVYCIKMILEYYHLRIEAKNIKLLSKYTNQGLSIYGIIQCLKYYQIDAKSYQCDYKTFKNEAIFPCIVYQKRDVNHFVVVYKRKKDKFLVGDPASGLSYQSFDEFEKYYNNICILIHHVGRFDLKEKYYSLKLLIKNVFMKFKSQILKMIFLSFVTAGVSLFATKYYQDIIDGLPSKSFRVILFLSGFYALIYFLKISLTYLRKKEANKLKKAIDLEYVGKAITNSVYLSFSNYNLIALSGFYTTVNNLYMLSDFLISLYVGILVDGILILGVFISFFIINKYILCLVILCFLLIGVICYRFLRKIFNLNKLVLEKQLSMNEGIYELNTNFVNVKRFNLKRYMKDKIYNLFDEYIDVLNQKEIHTIQLSVFVEGGLQTIIFLMIVVASFIFKQHKMSLGQIIFLYLLLGLIIEPLLNFVSLAIQKDEISLVFEKYKEFLGEHQKRLKKLKRINEIDVSYINYSYNYQENIISNFSLKIRKSFILRGEIGSGKTTLLKLIAGYYLVDKGNILINGIDIKEIDLSFYYRKVIYLDNQPTFFNQTLLFNLVLDRNKEVKEFLNIFYLNDLEDKLDYYIDDKNNFLSSGQKQIVMLIRALLQEPEVLILDEALCNVESKKRETIIQYIYNTYPKLILIIVDHDTNVRYEGFDCVIL